MALFLGNSTYLSLEIMRCFCAILNTGPAFKTKYAGRIEAVKRTF